MVLSLNAAPKIKDKVKLALVTFHEREEFHAPAVQTCQHPLISTQLRQALRPRSSCSSTKMHQRVFLCWALCGPASPVQRGENPWLWWKAARMKPVRLSENDASIFLKDESIKHSFHMESLLPIPEKSHSPVFFSPWFSHPDTLFRRPLRKTPSLSFSPISIFHCLVCLGGVEKKRIGNIYSINR